MRHKLNKERFLDGEKLFRHYCAMGDAKSISTLARWAVAEGMVSQSGNVPTRMGVWKAMWRWASLKENKDVAYNILLQSSLDMKRDDGWWKDYFRAEITREEWDKMMLQKIKSAWQYPTKSMYERFLKKNGWA